MLLLLLAQLGWAQNARPAYFEGRLYLKLHNHLSPTLLPAFQQVAGLTEWRYNSNPAIVKLGAVLEQYGAWRLYRPFLNLSEELDHTYEIYFSNLEGTEKLMNELAANELFDYAELVPIHYADRVNFSPNDYNSNQQWFLNTINATGAWDVSKGSSDVVIAIVDDQVQIDHPDLAANIWVNPGEIAANGLDDDGNGYVDDINGWDVADNDGDVFTETFLQASHGTHVAGCASAVSNNGVGVSSIGYACKIMACKSTSDNNTSSPPTIDNGYGGISYAIQNGADVINMSWGGPGGSQTGQNIITAGWNKGVMIVAAAGNDNTDDSDTRFYPAAFDHVLSVGASNSANQKAWFSNYGTTIDVMTPGTSIRSTYPLNSYASMDGTSMASPITAGLCGLMKSANPCLTNADIEQFLKQTCSPINSSLFTQGKMGAGLINAQAALQAVQVVAPVPSFSYAQPGACSDRVQFFYTGGTNSCPDFLDWSITDAAGAVIATSNDRNPLITFPGGIGTYDVTLFAQNSSGVNSITQSITVNVGLGVYVTAPASIGGCNGSNVQLNAVASVAPTSVLWTPATNLSNPAILTPVLKVSGNATYIVTITEASGCVAQDTVVITAKSAPLTNIIQPTTQATYSLPAGNSVTLKANGATSYAWSPATGLNQTTGATVVATPAQTTTYKVIGTYSNGCAKTDSLTLLVTTGVGQELAQIGAIQAISPNPSKGEITLEADFYQNTDVQILFQDLTGRTLATLFEGKTTTGAFNQTADLRQFPAGIYLLTWRANGAEFHQKLELQ